MFPSSTLSATPDARRGRRRSSTPSAPPFAVQPASVAHQHGVGGHGPRISSGCARIAAATCAPPVQVLEAREHERHPLERQGEGDDAAAVDRGRDLADAVTSAAATSSEAAARCTGCVRESVAAAGPAARAAEREHPRVLAGAVVLELRSARPGPHSRSSSVASAFASSDRTGSSCSGRARWEAEAIAISLGLRSSRARTSGSAWNGFAEERRYATSCGSPASATTAPSVPRPRARGGAPRRRCRAGRSR